MRTFFRATLTHVTLVGILVVCTLEVRPAKSQATGQAAQNTDAYVVSLLELEQHRTGIHRPVRLAPSGDRRPPRSVQLKLIVDIEGNVVSAVAAGGPPELYDSAVSEAMTWKYIPFEKDGVPTTAAVTEFLEIVPPEEWSKQHTEFPHIDDLGKVVMKLMVFYGSSDCCLEYEIEIRGDGAVSYTGEEDALVTGKHRDRVSSEQVLAIVDAFRGADYFSLKRTYNNGFEDLRRIVTSFRVGSVSKRVSDNGGVEAGMPMVVFDLERMVMRLAEKWTEGNSDTVTSLKREAWDFNSPEAADLLARAGANGNVELLRELIAAGAAKNASAEVKGKALAAAAERGNTESVQLLLDYGANVNATLRDEPGSPTVLMWAAKSGTPELVGTILAERPNVNARDGDGQTALWYISASLPRGKKQHADSAQVVHLLASAGADMNARDKRGETRLHRVSNPKEAAALIEAGADVNVRNSAGQTPLMTNRSIDVVKLLVADGTDVSARDDEGKTALDHALGVEPPEREKVQYLQSLSLPQAKD